MLKLHMPGRAITPSGYVGANVRKFRTQRGWGQQKLVDRLHELGVTETGWDQPKIHRLETGKRQKVSLEDVFELALALDVSPLHLMTPMQAHDEDGNSLEVWLGGDVSLLPHDARQWIRGVRPALPRVRYASKEEAEAGHRFYLVDSQPISEWSLIAASGKYASRVQKSLEVLKPSEEDDDAE
jgi:transcriptional regulator with XRE-family HTH domain